MRVSGVQLIVLQILLFAVTGSTFARQAENDSAATASSKGAPGRAAHQRIERLDFKNTDLKDVVRALATKYRLNVFVEQNVERRVTIHLVDIPVHDVLHFIADENELELDLRSGVYYFRAPPPPEPVPPPPLDIRYENELLSLNLTDEPLSRVVEGLTLASGKNVVISRNVQGRLSGFLQNVPFEQGLKTLATINGFDVREADGIYFIENQPDRGNQGEGQNGRNGSTRSNSFRVEVQDSLVSLDVVSANLQEVLQEILAKAGHNLVLYESVNGAVTARFSKLPLRSALSNILRGTQFAYREENGVFLVGGQAVQGIHEARLVRLKHLEVEQVTEMLPQSLLAQLTLKAIKEHNGFMLMGAQESIEEMVSFINEIDRPIAQVLIEALVIDVNRQKLSEYGVKAGVGGIPDTSGSIFNTLFPSLDITASGAQINNVLDTYGGGLGLSRINKLPDNFYLQIKALENEGKANVRSRPQIATLNGHTASISIGTTQYFILKTETPISGTNQVVLQESERFETITAEMLLKVTPWVTATGEIIAEIRPEFSTPKNGLDSTRPPTIDHRILESTVKLKDGETIVLGGLIQEFDTESVTKFPILGSLPIIGKLFQSRSSNKTNAELIIYLTPHVYYVGDEMNSMQGYLR